MGDLTNNLSRHEFACNCGCGLDTVDYLLAVVLQDVRSHYGRPITITSGCRCPQQNRAVGGSENSQHMESRAADFTVEGVTPDEVYSYLNRMWEGCFGIGAYPTHCHLDTRTGPAARWGANRPPPVREGEK